VTLNPRDFPQSLLSAHVIGPGESIPTTARRKLGNHPAGLSRGEASTANSLRDSVKTLVNTISEYRRGSRGCDVWCDQRSALRPRHWPARGLLLLAPDIFPIVLIHKDQTTPPRESVPRRECSNASGWGSLQQQFARRSRCGRWRIRAARRSPDRQTVSRVRRLSPYWRC